MTWQEGRPGDDQGGMRHALDLVAAQVPEPDLAESTWRQGRRVRRQRHVATAVGGVAAVAMVVGTWSVLADRPSAAPAGSSGMVLSQAPPTPVLEDVSRAEAELLEAELLEAELLKAEQVAAQRLWASLRVSCLEAQGMDAWTSEDGRGVSSQRPDVRGLPGLQGAHDLCDQTMVLAMPSAGEFEATVPSLPRSVARGSVDHLHLAYSRTATCLGRNGFRVEDPPAREEYGDRFTALNGPGFRAGDAILPPWHPYAAVLAQHGSVADALEVCPVSRHLLDEPEPEPVTVPSPSPSS